MADTDYFLDLSSPDPLTDEVPSSVRPASRRITKSQHDLSAFSKPQSSPRRVPRAQSPRKRTFELDVGNERSPQRIRVTVEAEEALKRGAVNRKLFLPSASPTRGPRRREATTTTTTTTTVPLNDDPTLLDAGVSTPQKRGRRRRTSNGTPMPRGQKRAGTPIERRSKQARYEDVPSSEAGIWNGELVDVGGDGAEETPKPKTRTRKTPRKPAGNTSVPSSQASGKSTGRKRGRPRKTPIPENPSPETRVSPQITNDPILSPPMLASNIQNGTHQPLKSTGKEVPNGGIDGDDVDPTPSPARQTTGTTSVSHFPSQGHTRTDRPSVSPTSSNKLIAENDDLMMMSEDYGGAEPQSDSHSTDDEDGISRHGQDTIADASDFSMIAVESLPSFQASFRASLQEDTTKLASDYHEMGEQTSHIINQTLESLRHSLRSQIEADSEAVEVQNELGRAEDNVEDQEEMQEGTSATTDHEERRGLLSSPRRSKYLPLSRQVFVGRGNVDDSFSTIPDSILHAATPGRVPLKAADSEQVSQGGQADTYNDSFSEIPEAILEAATPGPARRVELLPHTSTERDEDPHQATRPPALRSSPDFGSNRLPTPEDTSSNGGSRKAHEEDTGARLESREQPGSVHRTDVPSSPPVRTRPRALDFGYSNFQTELNTVQGRQPSSAQRQTYEKIAPPQLHSLEAPHQSSRPSLSPIVRVGRTLQNVMSDNSSPDAREANLGSPFRGSVSSDHAHQSRVTGSSSPSVRAQKASNHSRLLAGSPSRLGRSFQSNLDRSFGRVSQMADAPVHSTMLDNSTGSQIDQSSNSINHQSSETLSLSHPSSMFRPTEKNMMDVSGETQRAAAQTDYFRQPNRQQSLPRIANALEPGAPQARSISTNNVASTNTDAYVEQTQSLSDEPLQGMDEDSDRFEDHTGDDEYGGDELDVWDIEASRTSPTKPESPRNNVKPLTKPGMPSSRRSKVPSPWRRNNRRLIYKDDIASSSQIEIEESSQSEAEQFSSVLLRRGSRESQSQQGTSRPVANLEPVQNGHMRGDVNMLENVSSPSTIHDRSGEHAGRADIDGLDDTAEDQASAVSEQIHWSTVSMHEEPEEHEGPEQPETRDMPPTQEASVNMSEYSMVAQQAKKTPQEQNKPPPSKPGFFGSFDILSFFSSPAVIPTNKSGPKSPEPADKPAISQPNLGTTQQKEPPKAFWSTGLFPAMPRQEANQSSGRRLNLSSPDTTLRSTDTVPDTYEPSSSPTRSPSPSPSRSASAAPSTPERQSFPPIEQKRNFTPRPGQSRGLLLASGQANPTAVPDRVNSDTEESSEEQESSALTETSEYERVPPREKPSQWDRNLSPTKSSFRSPLKPTTPGRVVAFSNSALPPLPQVETRNTMHNNTNARNIISQGSLLRPTFEGKENQLHPHHTQQIKTTNNNSLSDENNSRRPRLSSQDRHEQQQPRPNVIPATMKTAFALSQTEWTKQHWCRLDEILQLRRRDPLRFQQMCPLPPRDRRRSLDLVGKEISAQDARLILEPWHLEIVEAFKLEVGGWDEVVLAKRLFALIIGEEKRRAGAVR